MIDLINDFEAFYCDTNLVPYHENLMQSPLNIIYTTHLIHVITDYTNISVYMEQKKLRGIDENSCIIVVYFNHDSQELDFINTLRGHLTP